MDAHPTGPKQIIQPHLVAREAGKRDLYSGRLRVQIKIIHLKRGKLVDNEHPVAQV